MCKVAPVKRGYAKRGGFAAGVIVALGLLAAVSANAIGVGSTTQISQGEINGNGAFFASFSGASDDGSRVFFSSNEQLTAGDADASLDIYLREGATTTLISDGEINGDGVFNATFPTPSADGSRIVFLSNEQLTASDTDATQDVYMRDGATTTHISENPINPDGAFAAGISAISADGSKVFFRSNEQLTASDADASQDIYLREGTTTTQVSEGMINGDGAFAPTFAAISADGARFFFRTAEPLTAGDTDTSQDIYMREGATTTLVSEGATNGDGAFDATFAGLSTDGSRAFFTSDEQLATTDTDASQDVYVREGATTTQVSQGAINGNGPNGALFVGSSSDGSRAFFLSGEQLESTDTDSSTDLYLREGTTTTHISRGAINGDDSFNVAFVGASADGSRAFFTSNEQLAATDNDTSRDVYLYLSEGATTTHISVGAINGNGAFNVDFRGASADGSRVFFLSSEQLAAGDTDTSTDIYMREGATTAHVSQGEINGDGAFVPTFAGASIDGSRVFFTSPEPLAASDGDVSIDVFLATIDSSAPQTTITGAPADPTTTTSAEFTYSAGEPGSSFECKLDGGAFAPCPGSGQTVAPLTVGSHTFEVRATDPAQNTDASPATYTWQVVAPAPDPTPPDPTDPTDPADTTAPNAFLTNQPARRIKTTRKKAKVSFEFGADESSSSFECSFDGSPFAACTSPFTTKAKSKAGRGKKHSFSVRATDPAGNTGPAATVAFKVKLVG